MVQMTSARIWWYFDGKPVRSALPYWSAGNSVGYGIAFFGGSLMALAVVVGLAQFLKTPLGTSTSAAVMILITAFGFWVFPPMLLVALLTQGANLSAVDAAVVNRGGHGFVGQLLGAIRFNFS